ncbi:MAG: hypothetical protein GEU80_10260 [Dehalococcoidia bacterium]|nr:hypothetical protein [Dehalococcoidia bacterium]
MATRLVQAQRRADVDNYLQLVLAALSPLVAVPPPEFRDDGSDPTGSRHRYVLELAAWIGDGVDDLRQRVEALEAP